MTVSSSWGSGEWEEWDYRYTKDNIRVPHQYQFIKSKRIAGEGDSNNDGLFDCFKTTIHMPKKLTDGNLIPLTNIWCGVTGVRGICVCSYGGDCHIGSNILWFKFNGKT